MPGSRAGGPCRAPAAFRQLASRPEPCQSGECRRLREAIGVAVGDANRAVSEVAGVFGVSWPTAHAAFVEVADRDATAARLVAAGAAPRADARNFAKRLVREGFRRSFPAACAVNVVVRVRKRLDRNTAQQGAEALARLLRGVQEKCGKY